METSKVRNPTLIVVALLAAGTSVIGHTRPNSGAAAGKFIDVTQKLGIHFQQQAPPTTMKYLETMGSGVALFDYDNDGRLDIFFANGAAGRSHA